MNFPNTNKWGATVIISPPAGQEQAGRANGGRSYTAQACLRRFIRRRWPLQLWRDESIRRRSLSSCRGAHWFHALRKPYLGESEGNPRALGLQGLPLSGAAALPSLCDPRRCVISCFVCFRHSYIVPGVEGVSLFFFLQKDGSFMPRITRYLTASIAGGLSQWRA